MSQINEACRSKYEEADNAKQFGRNGCQAVMVNGKKCGERQTLQICREFNNMYQKKMKEIDEIAGGDCCEVSNSGVSIKFFFFLTIRAKFES